MNVLEQIDAYMAEGMTEEQASELVDYERHPEDYYDSGFDEEYEKLLNMTEDDL